MLKDAGLFYLDDFSPEAEKLYQQRLDELKERDRELRARRKEISRTSETGAKAINIGFHFNRNDCRSLFDPIDYIIFEGLSTKGSVRKILFVDIKTGGARLNDNQREIRALVDRKRVVWDTYEPEAGT